MAERKRVAISTFIDANGEETHTATPEAEVLRFKFEDSGQSREVRLADLPDNVRSALAWHGLKQKLADSYAGAASKDESPEDLMAAVLERLEQGEWVKAGERAEGVPSMIVEAVVAALEEAGQTVDDDRKASIREKLKDKDAKSKALNTPEIRKHYERIKADRAAERAAKAAEAAAGETGAGLADFA